MLVLHFEGWFQCRLATDPDPTDEPRGASGFTFAVAGEPDFDRVIRLQDPVALRSHGPQVGVFVKSALIDGQPLADHPLLNARVELLDGPKYESRNYLLGDGSMGPIEPFHIQISNNGVNLRRQDALYPENPEAGFHEIPLPYLKRRSSPAPMSPDPLRIADATGIADPLAYRKERRGLLKADLDATEDPVRRAALEKRIEELDITNPNKLQVWTLTVFQSYAFDINGDAAVGDPHDQLPERIDTEQNWPIAFWMGGWDADALCGYMRGMLHVPLLEGSGLV